MTKSLLLAGLFLISFGALAQRVSNIRAQMDGDNVKILFDLDAAEAADLFDVKIYSSHNNFTEPLKMITGDLGKSVKPGKDRILTWRAKEELVNFRGEIIFEVRATVMGGYYTISNPSTSSKFKRGRMMPINWQGGESGEKIRIELMKLNMPVSVISESVGNQGSYIWTIPKNVKPGKSYQVRISNTVDYASQGVSKSFVVKGKSPVGFILIPLLIGGGAAAYVLTQDDEGTVTPPVENEPLPEPPAPTN